MNPHSTTNISKHLFIKNLTRNGKEYIFWEARYPVGFGPGTGNLVFTDALGKNLVRRTVVKHFKAVAQRVGVPDARFQDLRHSFAVTSLQAGDDIKTVQTNLGHATAAFTLDVYGHVTEKMKRDSATRMQKFYESIREINSAG